MGCDEEARHERKAEKKASNSEVYGSKCIEMITMSLIISCSLFISSTLISRLLVPSDETHPCRLFSSVSKSTMSHPRTSSTGWQKEPVLVIVQSASIVIASSSTDLPMAPEILD